MKVQFTDSFGESLKKLIWHQHWLYKTYALFRYDIPLFIKNVWRFRRELWDHQWWDYRFTLNMLERSIRIMENGISEKGMEIDETKEPKLKQMRRAIELLRNNREDNYIERAEWELGMLSKWDWEFEEAGNGNYQLKDNQSETDKKHDKEVFDRANEIEEEEWKELWEIFKGTKSSKKYNKNYDGTDMRAWWD